MQTDKTKESIAELVDEYNGIVGPKPITAAELKDEQANATLDLPGSFETVQQLSGAYGQILQYGLPDDYYNTFTAQSAGRHSRRRQRDRPEVHSAQSSRLGRRR